MAWLPRGEPARPLERRILGDSIFPPFYELYQPAGLHWLPSAYYVGRLLQRGTLDLAVEPIQFAAPAFDPQNLEWTPKGPPPQTFAEVRKLGDFAQPAFDELYKPEGLQWVFEGQLSVRGIPYTIPSAWIVDPAPVVTVAFDPQFFPFQVTDIILARVLQRTLQSDYATPPLPPGQDVTPPAVLPSQAIRNFSLREWRRWHRPEDEKRLRELKLTPAVAEIIAEVAERQTQRLETSERERIRELTRELELKRIRFQARYLELLNIERQQLIDAEIKEFYESQTALNEENKRRLLLLLTILS